MDNLVLDSQEEITQQKDDGKNQNKEAITAETNRGQQAPAAS